MLSLDVVHSTSDLSSTDKSRTMTCSCIPNTSSLAIQLEVLGRRVDARFGFWLLDKLFSKTIRYSAKHSIEVTTAWNGALILMVL